MSKQWKADDFWKTLANPVDRAMAALEKDDVKVKLSRRQDSGGGGGTIYVPTDSACELVNLPRLAARRSLEGNSTAVCGLNSGTVEEGHGSSYTI